MMEFQRCALQLSQHGSFRSVHLPYSIFFMCYFLRCLKILPRLCCLVWAWQLLLFSNPGCEAVAFVKMCRALCVIFFFFVGNVSEFKYILPFTYFYNFSWIKNTVGRSFQVSDISNSASWSAACWLLFVWFVTVVPGASNPHVCCLSFLPQVGN